MKRIEDYERQTLFIKALEELPWMWDGCDLRKVYEHFFQAGYEAAIAERAKFDEQNGLIVKDIGEL